MSEVSGVSLFRAKVKERGFLSVRTATEPVPISDLELVPICGEYETWLSGEELLMRAQEVEADLGQDQVEYMLERRDEFPEGWELFSLEFPGVVRRDRGNSPYYLFFYHRNGEWSFDFTPLDSCHPASGRLVRLRRR